MTFEVYRASDRYEYDPITFYWQSLCDTNAAALFISRNWTLTVSYVRPCAQAEFYRLEFDSFQVDSTKFDFNAKNYSFILFQHEKYGATDILVCMCFFQIPEKVLYSLLFQL